MKKLLLAASLIAAISPAFSQSVIGNSGSNNHGQGDCQCIGIGIPINNNGADQAPTPSSGSLTPTSGSESRGQDKIQTAGPGLWYTYFELYLMEIRNNIHAKSVN